MIQTSIRNSRNEIEQLDHNDPRYWEGPYVYQPYPKALYRQTQPGTDFETKVVQNQHEHERLGSSWHESPADAAEAFQKLEADIAKAAAERNFSDTKLSARAQAEALEADRATDEMQPEIRVRQKPGPKPKQTES